MLKAKWAEVWSKTEGGSVLRRNVVVVVWMLLALWQLFAIRGDVDSIAWDVYCVRCDVSSMKSDVSMIRRR